MHECVIGMADVVLEDHLGVIDARSPLEKRRKYFFVYKSKRSIAIYLFEAGYIRVCKCAPLTFIEGVILDSRDIDLQCEVSLDYLEGNVELIA